MINFFRNKILATFVLLFLVELFSVFGWLLPVFGQAAFIALMILTLILSLGKPEYGLWVLLAELFVSSKGYLFSFDLAGSEISARIGLWLVVMSVWFAKVVLKSIREKRIAVDFIHSEFFKPYFLFFIFLIFGLINGFWQKNGFGDIFFDFNNWLYFSLVFPFFDAVKTKEDIKNILDIFVGACLWLVFKTYVLLFVFSHGLIGLVFEGYKWVRETGVGEITNMPNGMVRIFIQSHIYILMAFFSSLFLFHEHKKRKYLFLSALFLSVVVVGLSRSFWVGLIIGKLFFWLILLAVEKHIFKKFVIDRLWVLAIVGLAIVFVFAIVKFPYPRPNAQFGLDLLSGRAFDFTNEAGASSRWALLPKLANSIKSAPIIGRGFGATVTYHSSDPRVLASSADGQYTTYAFEWGWLDVWLKLGLVGLTALLFLLAKIFLKSWREYRSDHEKYLPFSIMMALLVLAAVSFFSPYANHPLGLGIIILATIFTEILDKKQPLA